MICEPYIMCYAKCAKQNVCLPHIMCYAKCAKQDPSKCLTHYSESKRLRKCLIVNHKKAANSGPQFVFRLAGQKKNTKVLPLPCLALPCLALPVFALPCLALGLGLGRKILKTLVYIYYFSGVALNRFFTVKHCVLQNVLR